MVVVRVDCLCGLPTVYLELIEAILYISVHTALLPCENCLAQMPANVVISVSDQYLPNKPNRTEPKASAHCYGRYLSTDVLASLQLAPQVSAQHFSTATPPAPRTHRLRRAVGVGFWILDFNPY